MRVLSGFVHFVMFKVLETHVFWVYQGLVGMNTQETPQFGNQRFNVSFQLQLT